MDTRDLVLVLVDDVYSGKISADDALLLAHEIFDHQFSSRPGLQALVTNWVRSTFGEELLYDVQERSKRFGEEAIELIQATGKVSREEVHKLVDYVYDRPAGGVEQGIGGTMVTLFALASGLYCDAQQELKDELHRILDPSVTKKIKKKQNEKEAAGVGKRCP